MEINNKKEGIILENLILASIDGLFYMSETDAPFTIFKGEKTKELDLNFLKKSLKISNLKSFEEVGFELFFEKLTTEKDWFGENEKRRMKRYIDLKNTLQDNLKDLKVFRFGKIQIDIFIVGLDSESKIFGVKTKAVET